MKTMWLDVARTATVPSVATALGCDIQRRGDRAVAVSPCPACKSVTRHTKRGDRRGAVWLPNESHWFCLQCEEGGDSLHFVALALCGAPLRGLLPAAKLLVRNWYAERGWCAPRAAKHAKGSPARVRTKSRVEWIGTAHARARATVARQRPPFAEVADLWSRCRPVTDDAEISAYLAGRGLDPDRVADGDLARALPDEDGPLPSWACCAGRPWTEGRRLLLPVHDFTGNVGSLRARLIRDARGNEPKSSAASAGPGSAGGLVMANGLGRQILAEGRAPAWWGDDPLVVWIAEGEPDFLTFATQWSDADETAPAVFGVVAGGWTMEVAGRIPTGTIVIIATHSDGAGDRYATTIARSLGVRCHLRRWCARESA